MMYAFTCLFDLIVGSMKMTEVLLWSVLLLNKDVAADITHDVQWFKPKILQQYVGYLPPGSVDYFIIPELTSLTTWDIRVEPASKSCQVINVHTYFQYGSYPLVNINETDLDNVYLNRANLHYFVVQANNISYQRTVPSPKPGVWFVAAFLPKTEKKLIPKELNGQECTYKMVVRVKSELQRDISELTTSDENNFTLKYGSQEKTFRFVPPVNTMRYTITISRCVLTENNNINVSCPISVSTRQNEELLFSNCSNAKLGECTLINDRPMVGIAGFVRIRLLKDILTKTDLQVDININISFEGCSIVTNQTEMNISASSLVLDWNSNVQLVSHISGSSTQVNTNSSCILLPSTGIQTLNNKFFDSWFTFPNSADQAQKNMEIHVPDQRVLVSSFLIQYNKDIGGTLKIQIGYVDKHKDRDQESVMRMCLMKDVLPVHGMVQNECFGLNLSVSSSGARRNIPETYYIPYPEYGYWYFGLQSICMNKKNLSVVEKCDKYPTMSLNITMGKCLDDGCGRYGSCELYRSGTFIYSACQCFGGWKGYACTNGTDAESDTMLLMAMLLLTLSNLFFIPGIILALYRRYFIEACIYGFTMFFSTFYHACDTKDTVHRYCLFDYNVLAHGDYIGSMMSFWVTILSMTKLQPGTRSVLNMISVVLISMGTEYDRHSTLFQLLPVVVAVLVMITSWIRQCYKRKQLYPSKKRYIKFILPGILLAGTGICLTFFLQTEKNYRYIHSLWHITMSLSIVFLLPSNTKHRHSAERNRYISCNSGGSSPL